MRVGLQSCGWCGYCRRRWAAHGASVIEGAALGVAEVVGAGREAVELGGA
jgi:hypothetical protein